MSTPYPVLSRRLHVVILATNEERDLPGCLDAVPPGIKITVVQSAQSTDRTEAIAASRGAVMRTNPWPGFAGQRNYAMTEAGIAEDWILFIDADEIFTAEFWSWAEKTLATDPEFEAGWISSRLVLDGKVLQHAPSYPVFHPRLAKRASVRYVNSLSGHGDTFDAANKIKYIDIPYLHYFHDGGLRPWMDKHLNLAEKDLKAKGADMGGQVTARSRLDRMLPNGPWRAILRFLYQYIICRGFLDGRAGLRYCAMYAWYEMSKWVLALQGEERRTLAERAPAWAKLRTASEPEKTPVTPA
ncbi:MAG: glycosyltransferase family 2 protein [Alphaproteobacteria bacterium]|nr:glycosyltransferase family 2 protein [Alphaproteobacteria bacterium]